AGLEEGFDALLRADGLRETKTALLDQLLNLDIIGGDMRSTLDIKLQKTLFDAMQGHQGAALVAHVPSGEVLAMVSVPTYDPNQPAALRAMLDEQENGDFDPEKPPDTRLLNRVTAGRYQPGGALETLILSAMLAGGSTLDDTVLLQSVTLADPALDLDCTLPPGDENTLRNAYLSGCPAPFVGALDGRLTPAALEELFRAAGLQDAPILNGFLMPEAPIEPGPDTNNLTAEAAGQGALTVKPLHLIQVIAAVVNEGRGIPLHLADATRYPGDGEWQSLSPGNSTLAMMQPLIAQQIENTLRERDFSDDRIFADNRGFSEDDTPIYGHISRAFAGEREYIWFLGWTPLSDGTDAVIVVVLESPEGMLTPDDV
ncbi:MAG TPA: penicillin-binding transpeptidase domain-containing protein, partial [Aggregatilineales bacterium]|nr:penicillin-binding transpeptidase domain-containing protein [Aggregatilineales bacterium]